MTELVMGSHPGTAGTAGTVRRRHRTALVGLTALASVAALAGCSGTADGSADSTLTEAIVATVAGASDSVAPTTAAPDTPAATEAPAVTVPIDAPVMLQQAIDAAAGGYHFRTVVALAGAEVLVAEGDRFGDGTRLTIWTSGTSLSYVISPAGSWVVPDGGEWEALDSAPATTDPLIALRTPSAVSGTSTDGVAATLVATVAATALGVPSDGPADVQVLVNGPTLQEVRYQAVLDGQIADVTTVFSTIVDATPVTPPI